MTYKASDYEVGDDKLIQLDTENRADGQPAAQGKDLNAKLDMLDDSLAKLNTELDTIRDSVDEGLEKLGDNDLDLTSKVSDTYKRLGELDNTYRSLSQISANIHDEISRLTNDISRVATQSSAELEKLEATSEVHNSHMVQQHDSLAQRVDALVKQASDTRNRLQLSIKDVQHSVLDTEKKLLIDIDSMADASQERDELLARELDEANSVIERNAAKIIKLNKVDEALAKRAAALETTTTELEQDLTDLDTAVIQLSAQTEVLEQSVEQILAHTAELQQTSDAHGALIGKLQSRLGRVTGEVIELGDSQRLQLRSGLGLLLLVAFVITGVYLNTASDNQLLAERINKRASLVNQDLGTLDQRLANSNQQLSTTLVTMKRDLSDKIVRLQDKVASVDRQLQHVRDETRSLNGRLAASSPLDNFGGDNIVHGAQWLRELPVDAYTIELASVADSRQMHELVQRYSSYLEQPVSHYVDSEARNVLLYGSFDSEAAAIETLRRLPYRVGERAPQLRTVASVQSQL